MKAYLLSVYILQTEYILVYADSEQDARLKASKEIKYNGGAYVQPEHFRLCTIL